MLFGISWGMYCPDAPRQLRHRIVEKAAAHSIMLLSPFSVIQVHGASLQEVWNFSAPALRDPQLDPNGLRINILYNVSDYITPSMVNYKVSNWDCNVTVEEWFVPSLISPDPTFIQGDGTGDGVIEIEVNVDPDAFDSTLGDTASFWQQDSQDRYQVRFCLFTGVQTDEENPIVVDSSETQIAVTYDLTDGFALSVEVTPVRNEENANDGYRPEGYFCNQATKVKLTEDKKDGLATPGAQLSVCVVPDERAQNGGLVLDKINEFTWQRVDSTTGVSVEQVAVMNGQVAGNGLTDMVCDDDVCNFISILSANFFQTTLLPPPTGAPTVAPTVADNPLLAPTPDLEFKCPACMTHGPAGWDENRAFDDTYWWGKPLPGLNPLLLYAPVASRLQINGFGMTSPLLSTQYGRLPTQWRLEGLDAFSLQWVTFHEQSTDYHSNAYGVEEFFSINVPDSVYKYIRFEVFDVLDGYLANGASISMLQLYGAILEDVDIVVNEFTEPVVGSSVTCETCIQDASHAGDTVEKAFDSDLGTKFFSAQGKGT